MNLRRRNAGTGGEEHAAREPLIRSGMVAEVALPPIISPRNALNRGVSSCSKRRPAMRRSSQPSAVALEAGFDARGGGRAGSDVVAECGFEPGEGGLGVGHEFRKVDLNNGHPIARAEGFADLSTVAVLHVDQPVKRIVQSTSSTSR